MIIRYFADDGTEFEDEWTCELYEKSEEMKKGYPALFEIDFWDDHGKKYKIDPKDIFDDGVYNKACKVNIPSEDAYNGFHEWAAYCGWCEFEDEIDRPGLWKRHGKEYLSHEWVLSVDM